MRIGTLSERSGLSRDTIRFYERRGLIASRPEPGGTNSYRSYSEDALLTLEVIREAQAAGIGLDDLTLILGQFAEADEDFDGVAFLDEKITQVEARIRQSQRFLRTLKQTRAALIRAAD